jgi:hypothetical protein
MYSGMALKAGAAASSVYAHAHKLDTKGEDPGRRVGSKEGRGIKKENLRYERLWYSVCTQAWHRRLGPLRHLCTHVT